MPETILETERMLLRTEAPSDFEIWMEAINTPAVREYLSGVETADRVRETFTKGAKSQAEHGFSFWFLEDRTTGQLLGCCGLKRADAEGLPEDAVGELEVGWLLREDAWRKGLATEAACAAVDFAFARLDAPRVISLTSRSNIGSWRIMEKLGMAYRPDWDFIDPDFPPRDNPTIVYEITRESWENPI